MYILEQNTFVWQILYNYSFFRWQDLQNLHVIDIDFMLNFASMNNLKENI